MLMGSVFYSIKMNPPVHIGSTSITLHPIATCNRYGAFLPTVQPQNAGSMRLNGL